MGGTQDLHVRFAMIALYLFMLEMNYMLIRSAGVLSAPEFYGYSVLLSLDVCLSVRVIF